MVKDRPNFVFQISGGDSRPARQQDQSRGWREYFQAQELLMNKNTQIVMKTSEIAPPADVMIITATGRYITDLSSVEALDHLSLVGASAKTLRQMHPKAPLILAHCNVSDTSFVETPQEFGQNFPDRTITNSQSLAVYHWHCSAFRTTNWKPIDQINQSAITADMRRHMSPILESLAQQMWALELSPALLQSYPQIFESMAPDQAPSNYPRVPFMSLGLRTGLKVFHDHSFAQALCDIHQAITSRWAELNLLITSPFAETAIESYIAKHPWFSRHQNQVRFLASRIKPQTDVTNRENWFHEKFNYTVGVADFSPGRKPFLFLGLDPASRGGVQSVGLFSERDHHSLSEDEIRARTNFRAGFIHRMQSIRPDLELGLQGEYELEQAARMQA